MSRSVTTRTVSLALVVVAGFWSALAPASADTGSARSAWWSRANGVLPGVVLPAPGDVGDGELHIAGDGGSENLWQAVAALDVVVPPGARVVTLRLLVDDDADNVGSADSLQLCAVLAPFEAVANGAWDDVPEHECTDPALATRAGDDEIVFAGIDRFVSDGHLRVLVVPGTEAIRVVLRGPDASIVDLEGPSEPPASTVAAPTSSVPSRPSSGGETAPPRGEPGGRPVLTTPPTIPAAGAVPSVPAMPAVAVAEPAPITDRSGADWLMGLVCIVGLGVLGAEMRARHSDRGVRGIGEFQSPRTGRPAPV